MNIIHGRTLSVPRFINLEMLAKISVLVDYYASVERVETFYTIWIDKLRDHVSKKYLRDALLWIWISWVFHWPLEFQVATRVTVQCSKGLMQTMLTPIPERIVGM
jgi:hypothetical protein